jgi:antitoxin component of RelBE/YafQ-DinJ toxin-antitoxin module
MRAFSVRINDELHNLATHKADEMGLSLTELVRQSVNAFCTQTPTLDTELASALRSQVTTVSQQLHSTEQQLQTKDQQIEQLHQLVAMAQSNTHELSKQLDRATLQLEDLQKQTWWRRLLGQANR